MLQKDLRYLRLRHDLTLEEVAKKTGTTKQYISLIELGKCKLSDKFKVKLADVYGVPVDELSE